MENEFVIKVPISGFYRYVEKAKDSNAALSQAKERHVPWERQIILQWDNAMFEESSALLEQLKKATEPERGSEKVSWKDVEHLLGVVADTQIAKILGVSTPRVRVYRLSKKKKATQTKKKIDWQKWLPEIGQVSDTELAYKIGCSRSTLTNKRRALGIDAYKK
jgi:RecA-family ATPase